MKQITFNFKFTELNYDIQQIAYIIVDTAHKTDEHALHQLADIAQEGNIDMMRRWLSLAHKEIALLLYRFTKQPVSTNNVDNTLTTPQEYTITMDVHDKFAQQSADYLKDKIHQFMIWRVLLEATTIMYPEYAAVCKDKLSEIEEDIRREQYRPSQSVTSRKKHPF